jgi:hypothetical protein
MKRIFEHIRNFGLYINGHRARGNGIDIHTNPFSGRVIGRVFLTPQESLIANEGTPHSEEMTPTEDLTPLLNN